ncbi:hypothetical protein [Serratia sp. UGAL515B_01]|uniref:hypothetical protein n=1 Tax=Serratia sp. UGAL515B_01 TaxID=2986763 RepID=UPI002955B551|nr:hypothetical protein [Serratia sp. UGAL515B_01]WON77401.1 hypothetical protein OK023_01420 [Serratia sp. UGAL515B_01]
MMKSAKPKTGKVKNISISMASDLIEAIKNHTSALNKSLLKKKSKSKVVSDIVARHLEFNKLTPTEEDDELKQGSNVALAPESLYIKWHSSLYMHDFQQYLHLGDHWRIIDFVGLWLDDGDRTEMESLQGELWRMYSELYEKNHRGSVLSKVLRNVRKNENIKILAVRVKCQELKEKGAGNVPVFNLRYAVTLVNLDKNTNDKEHLYFDYHSIRLVDFCDLYENPIKNMLKNEQGKLPISYAYWLPIYVYQNKVLLIGARRKNGQKKEIMEMKKNKIIIVRPQ